MERSLSWAGWFIWFGLSVVVIALLYGLAVLVFHRTPNNTGFIVGMVSADILRGLKDYLRKNLR